MLTAMTGAPACPRPRCCSQKRFRDIAIRNKSDTGTSLILARPSPEAARSTGHME